MKIFYSLFLCCLCFSLFSAEISGEVVKVLDGDTVIIQDGEDRFKVRLAHIDAPEKDQEGGDHAKMTLSILIDSKFVYVEYHKIDMYGRIIGTIYLRKVLGIYSENINKSMVKHGAAWWYEKFSNDSEYAALQAEAKQNKLGIWADHWETCIPPWEYRKLKKEKKQSETKSKRR